MSGRPAVAAAEHNQVFCFQRTGIWLRPGAKSNGVTADTCGQRGARVRFDLLGLDEPVRRDVLAVAASRRFARGMVLFHEGEAGGSLHVLMRGRASVWVTTPSGDTVTLNVIGPGTAFGELSLLLPVTDRTATVQAIEPVETLVLQRADFQRLRRSHPSVDRLLVEYLAAQVRRLSERLTEALCIEARTRVLRRLLDLNTVFDNGPVSVTQEEISTMAGTTRPTVNRVMQDLAEEGIVELGRGRFTVVKPAALARAAR
jgi:CRP/FNR family transcriptional regulator, cyclic AMP receptor protein